MLAAAFSTGMLAYDPRPAYTQDLTIPNTTLQPAVSAQITSQNDPTVEFVTCPEDPPMGQRAKLLDDQEIGIAFYVDKTPGAVYYSLDNPRDTKALVEIDYKSCSGGACKSIQSPAITMVDLDGNDQSMAVMAFRDSREAGRPGHPR